MNDDVKTYWNDSGLASLVADFDRLRSGGADIKPYPAQIADLVRIHRLVRDRRRITALEFGVGYSTLIIAHALSQNEAEFGILHPKPAWLGAHPFRLFTVDAGDEWLANTQRAMPAELLKRVQFTHSAVEIGTFAGRLCHFYRNVPDVTADFVYLDGPHPGQVEGEHSGIGFRNTGRPPMAADLLVMEPLLSPQTIILVDGRQSNVRFLQYNFQRPFLVSRDEGGDVTLFELDEPPLGPRDKKRMDYQRGLHD
jgi:hypothetical protein